MIQFFTEYWTQIALVLSAIGFLIIKLLELRLKRHEIKYSLFHKARIEQVMKLYSAYIDFDKYAHTFANSLQGKLRVDYEKQRIELRNLYTDIAVSTIPFEFLANNEENLLIVKIRDTCKKFLNCLVDDKFNMEQITDSYKVYRKEIRPLMKKVGTDFRANMINVAQIKKRRP